MRSEAGRTWLTLRKQLVVADRRADSMRLIAAIRKIGKVE